MFTFLNIVSIFFTSMLVIDFQQLSNSIILPYSLPTHCHDRSFQEADLKHLYQALDTHDILQYEEPYFFILLASN